MDFSNQDRAATWGIATRVLICATGVLLALGVASSAQAEPTLQDTFKTVCKAEAANFHQGAKLNVLLLTNLGREKLGKGSIVTLTDDTMAIHADVSRGPVTGKFDLNIQAAGQGNYLVDMLMDIPKKTEVKGTYPLTTGPNNAYLKLTAPQWNVTFKCYDKTKKGPAGLEVKFHENKAVPPDYLLHFDF